MPIRRPCLSPSASRLGALASLLTALACGAGPAPAAPSGPHAAEPAAPPAASSAAPTAPPEPVTLHRLAAMGVAFYRAPPGFVRGEALEVLHVACVREETEGQLTQVRCAPGKRLVEKDLVAEGADASLGRVAVCTRPTPATPPSEVLREVERAAREARDVQIAGRRVVVRTDTFVLRSYVHGPGPARVTTTRGADETVALPSPLVAPGPTVGEAFEAYVPAHGRTPDGAWRVDERFFPPRGVALGWRRDLGRADPTGPEVGAAVARLAAAAEEPHARFAVLANRVYAAVAQRDKPGALRSVPDVAALRAEVARWPDGPPRRDLLAYVDQLLGRLTTLAGPDVSLVDPCDPRASRPSPAPSEREGEAPTGAAPSGGARVDLRGVLAAKRRSDLQILSPEQSRALEAAATRDEPATCEAILRQAFRPVAEKLCDVAALREAEGAASAAERASAAARACGVHGVDARELAKLSPWGIVASAVVLAELDGDPLATDHERWLGRALVNACRRP